MIEKLVIAFFFSVTLNLSGQSLTNGDVYDMHVGDELGIKKNYTFQFIKVIDRVNVGTDSLVLTFFRRSMYETMQGKVYSQDTYSQIIGKLSEPIFKNFEFDTAIYRYHDTMKKYIASIYIARDSSYIDPCGRTVNSRYDYFSVETYSEGKEIIAFNGLGILKQYYYYGGFRDERYDNEEFIYYIKDGILCGDKAHFPLNLQSENRIQKIELFPNPSHSIIYVKGISAFNFRIVAMDGTELMQGIGKENQEIDIHNLPVGIYCILISDGNQEMNSRFVVE